MSKAVQAVIGVVEIVVGAILDAYSYGTLGNSLIAAGVGTLLNVAAQLLISPHRPPVQPTDVNYSGTLEPRRIVYGKMKLGGMHIIPPLTSGSNNDFLHLALAIAGHPISGFGDMYLGQTRIANGDIAGVTGTASDGLVSGNITNNGYQGKVWIRRYDGTQTTVDHILNSTFTVWDSNHIGHDIPYFAVQFQYDQKVFASGLPEVSGFVLGKKVYDPRQDSTNGGSGTQRYNNSSTWAYSTNPALCLRDFLTSSLGLNESQTRIDDSLVAAAANICDQTVTVPIPVLVGLTSWTNGSAVVGGVNTAFMAGLNNGQFTGSSPNFIPATTTYVKAPNGAMLQVASVQSDTQFTLSAAYTGTSASSQITQWNNSTSTTTTQARYSCNTVLDATARYEDNIAQLSRAMMGQCIYTAGKWAMYAGAWSGSAFTLAESDLVGQVAVQCSTPRERLYNAVRGNFINPQKNYQPDEFPPVLNSTYATDDGETIYTETNFPCCTDIFECQRNAFIVSRVSRDQKIVTALFGMSAYGVKVWETGTVTIGEIGWSGQTVRCIGWHFDPKGTVELTLQEAYSADWTDPLVTDYVVSGVNPGPSPGEYLPYPATALTTTSMPDSILIKVTIPAQVIAGTIIRIYEGTSSTPFSSAVAIAQGTQTTFVIPKYDTTTRYYWATLVGPNNQESTNYPSGAGVAGVAIPSNPLGMTLQGSAITFVGSSLVKASGSTAWDNAAYSIAAYQNGCFVTARGALAHSMIGLSISPASSANYTTIDYGIELDIATGVMYRWVKSTNDNTQMYSSGVTASDAWELRYDGVTVRWFRNGTLIYAIRAAGKTFQPKVCLYTSNSAVSNLSFGPSAAVNQPTGSWLNTFPWIVGSSGTQGNYTDESAFTAGTIILGIGPYGVSEPIWKGFGGSAGSLIDAGWYNSGDLYGIDASKTYRSVVWFQYQGTSAGNLYFGADTNGNTCTVGTQSVDSNPYFVGGVSLPSFSPNKWYLLVGFIHGSGYTGGSSNLSGIYDPISGQQVFVGTDYNLLANAPFQTQRAFAYNSTVGGAETFFFAKPRWEEVNGNEPSLQALMAPASALQGFVTTGTCVVTGQTFAKQGGSNAWDSCVYSVKGYTTAHITAKPNDTSIAYMIGFSTNPSLSSSYVNGNYLWYHNGGTWQIYESGTFIGSYGSAGAVTDLPEITYDGSTITYILNKITQRTVAVAGLTVYAFAPMNAPGSGWNSVNFGPTTNLAIVDTQQVGVNAATDIVEVSTASYTGSAIAQAIATASIGAKDTAYVATVTVSADVWKTNSNGGQVYLAQLTGGIPVGTTSQPFLIVATASPGNRVSIVASFPVNTVGAATSFALWYSSGTAGNFGNAANIDLRVDIVKR